MNKPINRIREVLKKRKKPIWLAGKLGKSFGIVNAYNRCQPSLETLFQIVEILGVDVKELISHKTEKRNGAI
jgi:hypothetical protein